ncbi:MAG: DNA polymerase III subunit epsilon [Pseudochelatococcus sp.]|uniref:DNA polymerase III subunit epsilon n=1 Tax=Pseudochelatococcus sp. TaxID=2020869 RepID=UPI003D8A73E5
MSREIVFDTETTGVDPATGDRVVEIGCVELVNAVPTGRHFHAYINPQRPMSEGAFRVHGLSDAFLSDKPVFAAIADAFIAFIADAPLVAHNASFDAMFINAEFQRLSLAPLAPGRLVDTLVLARRKHPGAPNSLDALCARYNIDNTKRTKHGALLDAEILAEVYIELLGGRQAGLDLSIAPATRIAARAGGSTAAPPRPVPLPPRLSAAERQAHAAFVAGLGSGSLWQKYLGENEEKKDR